MALVCFGEVVPAVDMLPINALKYAFPEERMGLIRVTIQSPAIEKVLLTVADDGVGLPAGLDPRHAEGLGLKLVSCWRSNCTARSISSEDKEPPSKSSSRTWRKRRLPVLDLLGHQMERTLTHDRIFGYETLLPSWSQRLDHCGLALFTLRPIQGRRGPRPVQLLPIGYLSHIASTVVVMGQKR